MGPHHDGRRIHIVFAHRTRRVALALLRKNLERPRAPLEQRPPLAQGRSREQPRRPHRWAMFKSKKGKGADAPAVVAPVEQESQPVSDAVPADM